MRVLIFGGGVGWGGMSRFIATATRLYVLLHFHTYVILRCWTFFCTSTNTLFGTVAQKSQWQSPRKAQTTLWLKEKNKNFSANRLGSKISFLCWWITHFCNFEPTLTVNLRHRIIPEILKCANYCSFRHFPHRERPVMYDHRRGLLQTPLPCFIDFYSLSTLVLYFSLLFSFQSQSQACKILWSCSGVFMPWDPKVWNWGISNGWFISGKIRLKWGYPQMVGLFQGKSD